MRGWKEPLAVILAACLGYALALWVHALPSGPAAPEPTQPEQVAPVPEPAPQPQPTWMEPKRHRPALVVRAAIRRLGGSLRSIRLGLAEQLLLQRGWRRFDEEIPEDIAYRGHDFLREVEAAVQQRWFAPAQRGVYERARVAWREVLAHRERLIHDHAYRAAESKLANLALHPKYKDLHLLAHSAPPFLHVYASKAPLSLWDLAPSERTVRAREDLASRQTRAIRILRRNAVVAGAVRTEFRTRYAKALAIPDLKAPYGGRADYPHGVRSFADGVVLVSVTYADRESYRQTSRFGTGPVQGFQTGSGDVLSLPQIDEQVTTPLWSAWYGREIANQLLHWYSRQRSRWRKPRPGAAFVDVGIAAWLGAIHLDRSGKAVWSGISGPRLRDMQAAAKRARRHGTEYKLFPIRKLMDLGSAYAVAAWVAREWQLGSDVALAYYREQAWAFAQFLNRTDSPYRKAFQQFLQRVLTREIGTGRTEQAFAEVFRLEDPDEWRELDHAFKTYVNEQLMKQSPLPYLEDAPKLEAWGR